MGDQPYMDAPQQLEVSSFELESGTTLIEASAGTGKTYTIQYIVLDLLLKGLSLPEILVVTFTEAATKELSDRLQSFLVEVNQTLSGNGTENAALESVLNRASRRTGAACVRRCIHRAMLEVDQAAIYTIHGFCQRALQENAFAADASFDTELCADVTPIVDELVLDFLRRVQLEMPIAPPAEASLTKLRGRALQLTGVLRHREPFQGEIGSVGATLSEVVRDIQLLAAEADAIVDEFRSYQGQLNGATYKADFFDRFESLLSSILDDPLSSNAKDLNKLSACTIQAKFKRDFKGTELRSPFFKACERLLAEQGRYGDDFLQCFDSWFIESFQHLKAERGFMTYDDMIFDLDRALSRSGRLKRQLCERYRAALVDEFQDTDGRQYSIFRKLFAESTEHGRYFAMIGDPKQSIYGFRGADISAYLKARNAAHYRYTLPMNYRSEKSVVDATNRFFQGGDLGKVLGSNEDESILFDTVDANDTPKRRLCFAGKVQPDRLYERALPRPIDERVKSAHQSSVTAMAEDVERLLVLSEEGRVYFESTEMGLSRERVRASDIAVLVNTNREAAEVQDELHKRGIVAVRSKTGSILETAEAQNFLYFLMACLDPSERGINLLLISSLFAKNDAELRLLSSSERRAIYELFRLLGKQWRDGAAVSRIWMRFVDERFFYVSTCCSERTVSVNSPITCTLQSLLRSWNGLSA